MVSSMVFTLGKVEQVCLCPSRLRKPSILGYSGVEVTNSLGGNSRPNCQEKRNPTIYAWCNQDDETRLIHCPNAIMPPLSRGLRRVLRLSFRSSRRRFGSRSDFFKVSEEVQDALQQGKPVVALETTIYTHGVSRSPSCVRLPNDFQASLIQRMWLCPPISNLWSVSTAEYLPRLESLTALPGLACRRKN